jgi:hypothetical protein
MSRKTALLLAVFILHVSCRSYRETTAAVLPHEVIYAQYQEGGFWIGTIRDPLEIANWELRISAAGEVQQRAYTNRWRTCEGKRLTPAKVAALSAICKMLPEAPTIDGRVYLGPLASDTTYLHIVLSEAGARRDVYLYAPEEHPRDWKAFARVWRAIARIRPVAQTPSGGV